MITAWIIYFGVRQLNDNITSRCQCIANAHSFHMLRTFPSRDNPLVHVHRAEALGDASLRKGVGSEDAEAGSLGGYFDISRFHWLIRLGRWPYIVLIGQSSGKSISLSRFSDYPLFTVLLRLPK